MRLDGRSTDRDGSISFFDDFVFQSGFGREEIGIGVFRGVFVRSVGGGGEEGGGGEDSGGVEEGTTGGGRGGGGGGHLELKGCESGERTEEEEGAKKKHVGGGFKINSDDL